MVRRPHRAGPVGALRHTALLPSNAGYQSQLRAGADMPIGATLEGVVAVVRWRRSVPGCRHFALIAPR